MSVGIGDRMFVFFSHDTRKGLFCNTKGVTENITTILLILYSLLFFHNMVHLYMQHMATNDIMHTKISAHEVSHLHQDLSGCTYIEVKVHFKDTTRTAVLLYTPGTSDIVDFSRASVSTFAQT